MNTIPRPEYPRPQMARGPESWLNLNGSWEFEFDFGVSGKERRLWEKPAFSHSITVPFCPESSLSGIGCTDFMPAVWYRRSVSLTERQTDGKVMLHFGAVDYRCTVWVNGEEAGSHRGGYASFALDITKQVKAGENVLVVCAEDDVRSGRQPKGKQSHGYYSAACDYTRTTGIWQTVWLEFLPETHIVSYRVIPQPQNSAVQITVQLAGKTDGLTLMAGAFFGGRSICGASRKCAHTVAFELALSEVHLWDVGQPNLYDLQLTLWDQESGQLDQVTGYFGLRELVWDGRAMCLNGKPVFQRLVLDQGFYPDGIYTAPTEEALVRDIDLSMALGFNGARLHQKVFEERYLYWADRKGYLVWGEMGSWGLNITEPAGLQSFLPEWIEVMKRDFNHPAIVGWCPFNETWDWKNGARQDDEVLRVTYEATKALDPTRPVIDTSGNFHVVTDIYDIHDYEQEPSVFREKFAPMAKGGEAFETFPQRQHYDGQPYFVSEYGGTWWNPLEDTENNWGYGNRPDSEKEVLRRFAGLTSALLENPAICALCYTQLTDVEQEQNGLYAYDRSRKFSDETYAGIKAALTAKAAIED